MKTPLYLSLLLGLIAIFSAACSTPTPTPLPPTATPLPPTAVPPTVAAAPGSSASDSTLGKALAQAKNASNYRLTLGVTGKGNFAAAGGPTPPASDPNTPLTLVNMTGEVSGANAHFVLQGMLTAFLGLDPTQPFEVMMYNKTAYIKGPVPAIGATEAKWYQAPPEAADLAQPPLSPASFLGSFGEAGINPNDFKLSGNEALDGKQCEIYSGDKAAVVNAFSRLGGATGATQEDLDSIDNAEFKFWVCNDGYLHQVKMLIEGHDKNDKTQKGSFEILMKLSDFEGAIAITAPENAELLKLPTPQPQTQPPQADVTPTP